MPYIQNQTRQFLDKEIESLAQAISKNSRESEEFSAAGNLNYAITKLVARTLKLKFKEVTYSGIALVTGVLRNVSDEFYRRVAVPYEEKKKSINGDVFGEIL